VILDQHFNSAMSLKQQSAGRHVTSFRFIMLILSQPIFAFTPLMLCA